MHYIVLFYRRERCIHIRRFKICILLDWSTGILIMVNQLMVLAHTNYHLIYFNKQYEGIF